MSRKAYLNEAGNKFEGLYWAILIINILASIVAAIICFCNGVWIAGVCCLVDTVMGSLMFSFIKWAWDFLCSCILIKGTKDEPISVEKENNY